jgi:hypothetical protein
VRGIRCLLVGSLLIVAACTSEAPKQEHAAGQISPVVASSPYLCDLVPAQALRLALQQSGALDERHSGSKSAGQCNVISGDSYLLYVGWHQEQDNWTREDVAFALKSKITAYTRRGGVTLPADLGEGMAAKLNAGLPGRPYEVSAKFLCGGKERFLTFSFAEFAEGRDAFKDMTEFMRIAQNRWAELYECDLGK